MDKGASVKNVFNNKKFKYGGYALIITLVGIALVVLLNIGLTTLENNFDLRIDTTQNKKYTLTDQTKQVVQGLTKDIYIYTTYPTGQQDEDVSQILQKFKGLSSRIHLENRDTELDPRFATPYTKDGKTISPGDIIVSDKDNKLFRILDQYAQYQTQYDDQGQASGSQIKVEGSLVTALNYINLGYMPTAFLVQGHGELGISDLGDINAYMSDQNYNLETVNIAQTPDKLKAGDIIMFFYPQTDISDAERDVLKPLMEKGGRFFFLFKPEYMAAKDMPNFQSLLKLYDIELKNGYVVEGDTAHMASPNYPLYLVPDLQSHAITDTITNRSIFTVIIGSGALKLPDSPPDSSTTIASLLKTSDKAFMKKIDTSNAETMTMDYQEGDEMGPFDLAAAVEKKNGSNEADSVRFVVANNTEFITNSSLTSSTNNMSLFLAGCSWMRNAENEVYVRPKLLSTAYFATQSAAQTWAIIVVSILLIPVLMLIAGIVVYIRRKHL